MIIETTEAVKTIVGTTRNYGCRVEAEVTADKLEAHIRIDGVIGLGDVNDVLQFFYHLRAVLGGDEGEVH